MPFIKKGDDRVQPGTYDQPCDFFNLSSARDSAGGVVDPANTAIAPVFAYTLFGNVGAFSSLEIGDGDKLVSETWATISFPWFSTALPVQGMRLKVKSTGQEFEVRGVIDVNGERKKVELTCKLVG